MVYFQVHKSYNDLMMDAETTGTHPRLQNDFYAELYKKYPHAFRRRLEAREAGRRLFNSKPQVRFNDEVEVSSGTMRCDENSAEKHLTNWDREVGHYLKHKSRWRDCVTSVEPSECSGSVLSVTQRLRLNSQNLNKLLYETSPLQKYREREVVQYDSGTENEQSLQDYMLEKSKERSRHRKKQHRIIIQRKINSQVNGESGSNKENYLQSRRWMSKSASPTARHRLSYSVPPMLEPKHDHSINIDDLLADSDLKIDTLLEKISLKMVSPDSPQDSAIDIETPSVQSLVTMETQKVVNSRKACQVQEELPNIDTDQEKTDGMESSPGSSASSCMRKSLSKQAALDKSPSCTDVNNGFQTVAMVTAGGNGEEVPDVTCTSNTQSKHEINNISDPVAGSGILTQEDVEDFSENFESGPGLLQVYNAEMGYSNSINSKNAGSCENGISESLLNGINKTSLTDNNVQGSGTNAVIDNNEDSSNFPQEKLDSQEEKSQEHENDISECETVREVKHVESDEDENDENIENVNYHADNESDLDEVVVMETKGVNNCIQKKTGAGPRGKHYQYLEILFQDIFLFFDKTVKTIQS